MICGHDHLARAMDSLGTALVPSGTARQVTSFAAGLPEVASGHILECRLAGGACDYSLVLTRGDGGFDAFARHLDGAPFWQDTTRVLAAMQGPLHDAGLVWLEFDAAAAGVCRPGFFVAPRVSDDDADAGLRLVRALAGLFNLKPRPEIAALMARLPAGARLKQVGFMAGRSADALRLVIDGLPASAIPDALSAAGWPGSATGAADLARLAQTLAGDAPCRLDLDLGAGIGRGLGIEIPGHGLRGDAAIRAILSAGLCCDAAAAALAANLDRRTLVRDGAGVDRRRLDFGLNHLKLARPEGAVRPEAKAYFSLLMLPDFSRAGLYHGADTTGE